MLVAVTNIADEPATAMPRAQQLVAASFPPVDAVLCTPEDAERADRAPSPFLEPIPESGVTVYACESIADP